MKTTKYRIWDKVEKKMITDANSGYKLFLNGTVALGDVFVTNDVIILLSTGLYDEKGKEIYDGDIMSYNGVVEFKEGMFCFNGWEPLSEMGYEKQEVIGNIYQNPELI